MDEPQPTPGRYWILPDTDRYSSRTSVPSEVRFVAHYLYGMAVGDVVYMCKPGEGAYIFCWGYLAEVVTAGPAEKSPYAQEYLEETESIPRRSETPEPDITIRVSRVQSLDPALEVYELPDALSPLPRSLLAPAFKGVELEAEQAVLLNSLIRSRGVEAPPDPAFAEANAAGAGGEDEERLDGSSLLAEALGSHTLSELARTIFQRAIDLAAQRGPGWQILTSSCVLFATVELGRHEGEARDAAQFLFAWFRDHGVSNYTAEFERFIRAGHAPEGQAGGPVRPTGEGVSHMTPSAVRVVETAARIARYVSDTEVIYARHVLGALLLEVTRHQSEVGRRLASMQTDPEELGKAYYEFLNHPTNDEDDLTRWRGLLFGGAALPGEGATEPAAPAAPRLPHINPDSAAGEDLLQIKGEVEGFANIIAAADVRPPLSIGLFGDWGSGKSFFISKLKEQVTEITKRVREKKEGEPTAYLSNIVQIDFNAWHYVEANLWASIVSHVFDNLNLTDEKEERKAEERKRFLLEHLDTTLKARTEAVRSVADKADKLDQAKAELSQKEQELRDKQKQLDDGREAQKETRLGLGEFMRRGVWPLVREHLREDERAARELDEAYDELGLKGAADNLAEVKSQLSAALTVAGRAQLQFNTVVRSRDVRRRALWLFAALVAIPLLVPLVFLLVGRWQNLGGYLTWAGETLALVVGGYAFVRPKVAAALEHAGVALDRLEGANRRLDQLYKEAEEERNAAIAAAEKEIERRRAEVEARRDAVEAKRAEVEAARRNLSEVERQRDDTLASLNEVDPARMLARFIEERASSKDYRQHLGIVALVHQDFKKLSRLMVGQDDKDRLKELRAAVEKMFADNGQELPADLDGVLEKYRIDRIVLYIDDLDRCPPKQVVDVLQAIHLLLAFPLFVVVVGVDARWVRHSLKRRYPGMLVGGDGDDRAAAHDIAATPGDYIEKIFQVPFWLRPMGDGGSASLLRGLIPDTQLLKGDGHDAVRATDEKQSAPGGGGQAAPPNGGAGVAATPAAAGTAVSTGGVNLAVEGPPGIRSVGAPAGANPPATASAPQTAAQAAPNPNGRGDAFSLSPEGLLLQEKERNAMVSLSEVIGRTPRTLKRFVNVYRIIRAGLKGKTLDDFRGTTPRDGQYRAVLLLLGVAHGTPDLAPLFFRRLKEKHSTLSAEEEKNFGLRGFLDELADRQRTPPDSVPEGWHATMRELKKFTRGSDDIPLGVVRQWAPLVVRYTFQHGHLSEEVS